jgi:hypothetical protein
MQTRDPLTGSHMRAVAQRERPPRAADIDAKNTSWTIGIFEHRLPAP